MQQVAERITVEYTCDWSSEDGNDQYGRIIVEHPEGGYVNAAWTCRGGMGGGAELVSNTTPWSDEWAHTVVNSPDICQGIGKFWGDLTTDEFGWPSLTNIVFETYEGGAA